MAKIEEINHSIDGLMESPEENIYVIFSSKQVPRHLRGKWAVMLQDFIDKLAEDDSLHTHDWRVLMKMIANTDFENYVMLTQNKLSQQLKIAQPHISKAIQRLCDRGYLLKRKAGKNNAYLINPRIIWKGSWKDRDNVLQLFPENA